MREAVGVAVVAACVVVVVDVAVPVVDDVDGVGVVVVYDGVDVWVLL